MKKKVKIPTKDMKDLKPISTIEFQVVTGQLSLSDLMPIKQDTTSKKNSVE